MTLRRFSPRRVARHVRHWANVLGGLWKYGQTGTTPDVAYQSMITLFCSTQGWSNDVIHGVISSLRRPYKLPPARGILGDLSDGELGEVDAQLRDRGYVVFPSRLPGDVCDRLLRFALTAPSQPVAEDGSRQEPCVYDRDKPQAPKHSFAENHLLAQEDIQMLLGDMSILSLAQQYLGCQPVLDSVTMWWSTSFKKVASSEAAQLYHFDMNRLKWIKFFIYLTDVTPRNGPHCFVPGSHRTKAQPKALLSRGYARIPDADMALHYGQDEMIEITGPRGTIIAEDTRGFHKGKPLEEGDRLLLEFEFSDCLFGGAFDRPPMPDRLVPELEMIYRTYPRVFSKFVAQPV